MDLPVPFGPNLGQKILVLNNSFVLVSPLFMAEVCT